MGGDRIGGDQQLHRAKRASTPPRVEIGIVTAKIGVKDDLLLEQALTVGCGSYTTLKA